MCQQLRVVLDPKRFLSDLDFDRERPQSLDEQNERMTQVVENNTSAISILCEKSADSEMLLRDHDRRAQESL